MKKWLGIIALLAILGGGIGYYMYQKPPASMAKQKSTATVDAEQLQQAFEADESKANETYLGKVIEIKGLVEEVSLTDEDDGFIVLNTGSMLSTVKCQLDHLTEHPKASSLKKGDKIKVKGVCSGYLMDVIIERAIIL